MIHPAQALVLGLALAAGNGSERSGPAQDALRSIEVFCYVETLHGGVKPEALDLAVCTHVIEAFLIPDASGGLRAANGLPRRELVRAARRDGCRVLVAIGGATVPGSTFGALSARQGALQRFSDGVARFVLEGGYDGVDLDWEFPAPSERELHLELVRAVRSRLQSAFATGRPGQTPLVVVGVTPGAHLEGYDFPGLAKEADYFVQFGYDFRNPALGPWAHTAKLWPDGAHQPIEASVRGVASEIVRRGTPREKLVIGLPLYASDGRPWVEVREKALATFAPLDPLYLESELEDGTWITGPAALEAKARRIIAGSEIAGGSAGGVALWQLGHQGPFRELTEALRRALPSGAAHRAARWPR
jgi:glycosyl hydrolase family 18 (putative chitinase)